jgi:hypothetical protein
VEEEACQRELHDSERLNIAPGHILRPPPNGTNWKPFPLKSAPTLSSNLSGLNSSASGPHAAVSHPIAHALTNTMAPSGTS